jgi:Ca2+-binding RTX toxin-like protein
MADSLPGGGSTADLGVDPETAALIDSFFEDTQGDSIETQTDTGFTYVHGKDAVSDVQAGLLPNHEGAIGTVKSGKILVDVETEAGTGFLETGNDDMDQQQADAFIDRKLDEVFGKEDPAADPAVPSARSTIKKQFDDVLKELGAEQGVKVDLRIVTLTKKDVTGQEGSGSNKVVFKVRNDAVDGGNETVDGGGTPDPVPATAKVFGFNMGDLEGGELEVAGIQGGVFQGSGKIRTSADDNTNNSFKGSFGNQDIDGGLGDDRIDGGEGDDIVSGGQGNDYVTGGSGNDILSGGEGDDTFGFYAGGNFRVTDFGNGGDKFNFNFAGLNSVEQLAAVVSGVNTSIDPETGQVVTTVEFGGAGSITLVGVDLASLTPDMFTFGEG